MFTQDELQNMLALINRVQITGVEAETIVALKQKVLSFLTTKPSETVDKK